MIKNGIVVYKRGHMSSFDKYNVYLADKIEVYIK